MIQESMQYQSGPTNGTVSRVVPASARIAAIHARVSTQDQADKGYSLQTQLDACQRCAAQAGYAVPVSHIFQDDYTGTSLNRPQLTVLRDLLRSRTIHALIVYDLDRLSRKRAHQLLLTEECEQAGVALHIVTMPATDISPEQQLLSNVKGIIAEYEGAKILERTARGRRGRAQAGFVPGGKRTLGYDYIKHADKGAHYEINPEEAALVRRIFQLYVQDGLSLYAIARQLTQAGIPTQGDRGISGPRRTLAVNVWQAASILEILRNETYVGTMYYGKTERLPGLRNPDKKTRWRRTPKAEWIPVAVPPIIPQDLFDAAQAQRQRNAQRSPRNRKQEYLLCNARVRCGKCGRVMTGQYNPARQYRFYRCNGRRYPAGQSCRVRVNAAHIEAQVWTAVERVLHDPALIAAELDRRRQGVRDQQTAIDHERQVFLRQIAQCDKALARWEAAYIGEAIDLDDFKAKKAEIFTRRNSCEQELARLDAQQQQLEQIQIETASLMAYCQQVRANLRRFDEAEKRCALDALAVTVVWHPDKLPEIRGSIPLDIASNAA